MPTPRNRRGALAAAAAILHPPTAARWSTPADTARELSGGAWYPADHLTLLADRLAAAAQTPGARLMVTMPPQHGKTELCSHWTPVWALERDPATRIILTSYGAEYAADHGRWVRNRLRADADVLRVRLADDSQAANRWATTAGGGMLTAGVGGGITGRGGDLIIIDDPVKDREQAESPTYRRAVWDWYRDTLSTRLRPGGAIVLVMTRWHRDDLAGRLLADAAAGGDTWDHLHLPALAEPGDPLGRAPGAALWPERYPVEALAATRRRLGPYGWASLYQGSPTARDGGAYWSPGMIEDARNRAPRTTAGDVVADTVEVVVSVDPAASAKTGSDETGIIIAGRDRDGRGAVLQDASGVLTPDEWGRRVVELFRAHRADRVIIEDNQGGDMAVAVVRNAARAMRVPAPPIRRVHARRGKALRAEPVAQLYAEGQVWHAAIFPDLDEQLTAWTPDSRDSPDRLDALVHALTGLLLDRRRTLVTY